ncbi:MAG TPA: peptide chain release factor N(5)-glutamine methyltransferase [Candidatus Cloacimonadota bacterium]|nr:peptide chain release factor N(5)-glutamine methyltransferase [Candidatus Cloacimonadota bacterium]
MTLAEVLSEAQDLSINSGMLLQDFLYILQEVTGLSTPVIMLEKSRTLSEVEFQAWKEYAARRLEGEPSQYIVGKACFYGRDFRVSSACLIPRPETEGLVELAIRQLRGMKPKARILDIGTGSGVIAITLKLECPESTVHATDISAEALQVARINANALMSEVCYFQADLWPEQEDAYDMVISNPPYVTEAEYEHLDAVVRDHEPKLALVAPDNGLAFYKRIFKELGSKMNKGGIALFEIGEKQTDDLVHIAQENGLQNSAIYKDLAGRDRYIMIRI